MYTLHMSLPFRVLVLGVLVSCGLGPQLACFMPDQKLTQSEMDCCKGMAGDCSAANMSQACCQTVVRTDTGVAAKIVRYGMPRTEVAAASTHISADSVLPFDRHLSLPSDHAPPDKSGGTSLILRI